jgi:ring-1,2-phenylacetyl-CoA epoxidase subunit PaaE
MAQFYDLTVTDIHKTIRDAVVVTLKPSEPRTFDFIPGQYLTFRRDFDGQELRRNYSICAGKDDGILQIGIKRVDDGAFSTWANTELAVGDTLQAMPPSGKFHTCLDTSAAKHYLGFAGGSGITPVLSILKTVLTREPGSQFTLVYANRGVNTIMFREELEDLKNLYMGRLAVIHVLESDAQEIDLFTGRIDADKCRDLFAYWIDIASVDTAFICGPQPMMLAISTTLQGHGLTKEQIKFELFNASQKGQAKVRPKVAGTDKARHQVAVTISIDGAARQFKMRRNQCILEAALEHDLNAPFACRAGVCSTCRAKVTSGEVEMIANHALEDYEVAQGYVLTCQCYPISEAVTVEYEGH